MCSGNILAQQGNNLLVDFRNKSRLGHNKICRHTSGLSEGSILVGYEINRDLDDEINLQITSQTLDTGAEHIEHNQPMKCGR
jgi:hypothetical protein